jgi:predicted dehydrogenase
MQRKVPLRAVAPESGRIRVALVGAGGFAQGMHLPNLARLRERFEIHCIMSRTGINARAAAQQWQASYATSELEDVLNDAKVELVIVATRHNLHAEFALRALRAGKHVLVEKPLALNDAELDSIRKYFESSAEAPVLMTGFNRRFSPAIGRAKELLAGRTTPLIVNYRMNAGFLPPEHWVHGPEGGGRNIGEACHIYDLFNALTGTPRVNAVSACSMNADSCQWGRNDNFVATLKYADGSVCTLTYTALGDKSYPKERLEVFADGKVLVLDDYKSLTVHGSRQKGWSAAGAQKGQLEELQALASALRSGGDWPIGLEEQLQVSRVSFEVERQITGGKR